MPLGWDLIRGRGVRRGPDGTFEDGKTGQYQGVANKGLRFGRKMVACKGLGGKWWSENGYPLFWKGGLGVAVKCGTERGCVAMVCWAGFSVGSINSSGCAGWGCDARVSNNGVFVGKWRVGMWPVAIRNVPCNQEVCAVWLYGRCSPVSDGGCTGRWG